MSGRNRFMPAETLHCSNEVDLSCDYSHCNTHRQKVSIRHTARFVCNYLIQVFKRTSLETHETRVRLFFDKKQVFFKITKRGTMLTALTCITQLYHKAFPLQIADCSEVGLSLDIPCQCIYFK